MKKYLATVIGSSPKATIELNPDIFSLRLDEKTLSQVIRVYESNSHQKTKKTKTRSEVDGSTRKIYKQKGTGGARHGSRKANLFVGGGVSHGPTGVQPGNLKLSKKLRDRALASIIGAKAEENALFVLDVPKLEKPSTKTFATLLKTAALPKKTTLMIYVSADPVTLRRSTANLENNSLILTPNLNPYLAARAGSLLFTRTALADLETRLLSVAKKAK